MRATPPLPLVAHLPPMTEVPCSQAFRDAVACMRPLRQFSPAAEQLGERLTRELVLNIEEANEPRCEKLSRRDVYFVTLAGTEAVYTYGRQGETAFGLQTGKLTNDVFGFEIIASHIAWDLGLPHVSYGILNLPDVTVLACPHPWQASRSLASFGAEESMDRAQRLAQNHPHMAQSFYALAAFDSWVKGSDRSDNNILIEDKPLHAPAVAGIDLEGSLTERYNDGLHPAQALFLKQHTPNRTTLQMALHTLTAIMNYPSARIEAIAQRAQLVCRAPIADEAITILEQRRHRLREHFAAHLPQRYQAAILRP
jgi:hypothetical protein